jgi:hypothetical protein
VSRPGRGVVDEETCPIVRARGCSAGFIGTGFQSAAPPKFPAGPIRSRPWRLGPQPGAYKYGGSFFVNSQSQSSDLAFVSDGRDSSSFLSDRQGDCLVLVVLCSVPVPRPVFSTRSARFAFICAVLRSSPAIRPHNSLQRGPHWRKCRSSAFSSTHLKDPVLLHHKL